MSDSLNLADKNFEDKELWETSFIPWPALNGAPTLKETPGTLVFWFYRLWD